MIQILLTKILFSVLSFSALRTVIFVSGIDFA